MRKNLSAHLLIVAFLGLISFSHFKLLAEEETQPPKIQHEIVVTATRLETPVKETASAISLVRTEKLPPGASVRPEILFAGIPGLFFIQTGLAGGAGSIFIRGANSEHAVVMIDGLELNDPVSPSRSFNFNLFDLSLVDRVEILRGPAVGHRRAGEVLLRVLPQRVDLGRGARGGAGAVPVAADEQHLTAG